jgi:hypothetical protein
MQTQAPGKIDNLRAPMAAGDWRRALSIAAKFPRLGEYDAAIRAAHEACQRPQFQRQIGRDPEALVMAGVRALWETYD